MNRYTRQLTLIAALLLTSFLANAAISVNSVFDIRSTATASNVNGCFFVAGAAGTNYSTQDAAQFSGTDLASTGGTTNPCVVTSAGHNFVSTDVGNGIHVTAGTNWTQGWYQIVSVAGNAATLDRACGSAVSLSGGTWKEGGACSLGTNTDQAVFQNCTNNTGGQIFYIKNGTYTTSATVNTGSFSGGVQQPCQMIGYNASQGDTPTAAQRPVFNFSTFPIISGDNWVFNYLNINGSATSSGVLQLGRWNKVLNTKVVNTTTTANIAAILNGNFSTVIASELVSLRGPAFSCSNSCAVYSSYLHDSDIGMTYGGSGQVGDIPVINNIFAGNVTAGFKATAAMTTPIYLFGNLFYGSESKLGIGATTATGFTNLLGQNNIFYGLTTGLNSTDAETMFYFDYNDFSNNTTNRTNVSAGTNDLALAPNFGNVGQYTGTTATTSSTQLIDSGANFANVTDNVDIVYISSGTGVTAGQYQITAHTATTLTLNPAPSANATGDKVYQVTYGHNFAIGTNLKAKGYPGLFPSGLMRGYTDMGPLQRHEYGRPVNSK